MNNAFSNLGQCRPTTCSNLALFSFSVHTPSEPGGVEPSNATLYTIIYLLFFRSTTKWCAVVNKRRTVYIVTYTQTVIYIVYMY